MKNLLIIAAMCLTLPVYALDFKYAPIVKTALDDLKTHTKLATLRGHMAIHVSSGNKELDGQFGEELQKAFPNLTADTVHSDDLYELTVKVYREQDDVFVALTLTDYNGQKRIDRTPRVKKVAPAVLETLQYKTAMAAKNEFEAYLDSAFGSAGAVVREAKLMPDYIKSGLYFLETLEKYDSAITEFKKEIEYGQRKAEAYYYIGDAYYYQKKYNEAISYYTQTIHINPIPVSNLNYDDAYLARGMCYLEQKEYTKAIQDFNESEKLRPKNPSLYYWRGKAYFNNNSLSNAEEDFSKTINLGNKDAYAYFYRGMIFFSQNKYDKAISDFSKGIKIYPDDAYAYYLRAFSYYKNNNDTKKAINDCNTALGIDPNQKEARDLRIFLLNLTQTPPKKPFVMPKFDMDFAFGFETMAFLGYNTKYSALDFATFGFSLGMLGKLNSIHFMLSANAGVSFNPYISMLLGQISGNLEFFVPGYFLIGGGVGIKFPMRDLDEEREKHTFIRGTIGWLSNDNFGLKFYIDKNYDNGIKFGILIFGIFF